MELPKNNNRKTSAIPQGFDRQTLIKKGMLSNSGKQSNSTAKPFAEEIALDDRPGNSLPQAFIDTLNQRTPSSLSNGGPDENGKTRYQLEKNNEPQLGGLENPQLVKTLLDSSSLFRSKTAIPHGLRFDLHMEVYPIIEETLKLYKKHFESCISRKVDDPDMAEMIADAEERRREIGEYIGKDCDENTEPEDYTINKIYCDTKAHLEHN